MRAGQRGEWPHSSQTAAATPGNPELALAHGFMRPARGVVWQAEPEGSPEHCRRFPSGGLVRGPSRAALRSGGTKLVDEQPNLPTVTGYPTCRFHLATRRESVLRAPALPAHRASAGGGPVSAGSQLLPPRDGPTVAGAVVRSARNALVPPAGLEPATCGLKDRPVWRLLLCARVSSLRNMGLELQRHRWFGLAEYDGSGISCRLTAD